MSAPADEPRILLLGVGAVARAVARLAPERALVGTTRNGARAEVLRAAGIEPVVAPTLAPDTVARLAARANVLVSFPPDGATDARVAPACRAARSVVYLSSTAVYGNRAGRIDDATPAAPADARGRARLDAEAHWRAAGAVVLRAPGIYGPEAGLHRRLLAGDYRVPGDGTGVVSRVHVDDVARFVAAAFERGHRGETYVVGDLAPVPHIEVVMWLCERLGVPLPPHAPIETVHASLGGDRAIDAARALADLGVTLAYPTYREGFASCLADP